MSSRRRLHWFQKQIWLYGILWRSDPTSLSINSFPNDFMVSVSSFKSSSTQHDVHLSSPAPPSHPHMVTYRSKKTPQDDDAPDP